MWREKRGSPAGGESRSMGPIWGGARSATSGAEAAGTALGRGGEFVDHGEVGPDDGDEDQLGEAVAGREADRRGARGVAVPGADHDRAGVVGIDQPDEV